MTAITLSPAFGRDYSSADQVRAAFDADADFVQHSMVGGSYANKSDLQKYTPHITTACIKYNKQTKVCVVSIWPRKAQQGTMRSYQQPR